MSALSAVIAGARPWLGSRLAAWLGDTGLGLVVMALVVGAGAGWGAAAFRELIFGATWLATGYTQFGQQGHAASLHLPWLGVWFLLVVPVIGGLIYGPLIQRFAREARGHGVPEVMLAVAENGGRIRPPVTIVKGLASAICIGVGGSVGREGPIVQIGSALASTLGQLVRMSESRLRIIVACGAAGGIAATFNAPLTGLFFGFEIVLREFSLEALFATSLAAVTGDVISRAMFGSAPFFNAIPHDLMVGNDVVFVLVAVLALLSGLVGIGFKTVLYRMEDSADRLWSGRPEWARPAIGGVALGLLLLVLPEMYGVGYPVMDRAIAGHVVLGLVLLFLVGKVLATSLTLSIGGSGGVFAPSLFIGAMLGTAFGTVVHDAFGSATGPPALYAVVGMGAVFAGAAQAPLTAIASVAEMTGNFGLTLPIMLACAISSAVSKQVSHGSIYTTKLLRRGIDIERPRLADVLRRVTVADVMAVIPHLPASNGKPPVPAEFTVLGTPQALFAHETLEQALRQLSVFGRAGLPVVSRDRERVIGWLTRRAVLRVLAENLQSLERSAGPGAVAAEIGADNPERKASTPTAPLKGLQTVELLIDRGSDLAGRRLGDLSWPASACVVAVTKDDELIPVESDTVLAPGERVILLARQIGQPARARTLVRGGRGVG